jgi:FtsH-binding integral membrane protein
MEETISVARQGLLGKVMTLLAGSLVVSAVGTYLGRGLSGTGLIITMVLFIAGTIVVPLVSRKNKGSVGMRLLMLGWVFISGLFLGPAIHNYAHFLGWQTVFGAYLGSALIMVACGAYGVLSHRDFSAWYRTLFLLLLVIFALSIVSVFVSFGTIGNTIFCLAGIALFSGFFIVDFNRAAKGADDWDNAVTVTMGIYLDYINVLLFVLWLLGIWKGDD